ncbi:hypothetical protein E2C01_060474 [Portunus trituberculatus]|uniref:Uncharacterized protein n=1 Tax=Portunus trituberculatus TaxID=210409 RepID=A0A5B7HAL2_PORTR|nr:hypothetical protein [Portunus trituberculatus]
MNNNLPLRTTTSCSRISAFLGVTPLLYSLKGADRTTEARRSFTLRTVTSKAAKVTASSQAGQTSSSGQH